MDPNPQPIQDDDEHTTKKIIGAVGNMDERQIAEYNYNQALRKMLEEAQDGNTAQVSKETREAFEQANAYLYEIQDRYRVARKLLLEREEQKRREQIDQQIHKNIRWHIRREGKKIFFW